MTKEQTPQDANEATIGAVASTAGLGDGMGCKCAERYIKLENELTKKWDSETNAKHTETGKSLIKADPWPEPPLVIEATCQQLCDQALKLFDRLNFRQIEKRFVHLLPDTPYAHAKKQNHSTSYSPNVQVQAPCAALCARSPATPG